MVVWASHTPEKGWNHYNCHFSVLASYSSGFFFNVIQHQTVSNFLRLNEKSCCSLDIHGHNLQIHSIDLTPNMYR